MFNNKTVAIIGAMDCEIALLKEFLGDVKEYQNKNFITSVGKINNTKVIIAKSGVGKVAAASCCQYLIDTFSPDYILNTGVAGGVAGGLNISDIVVSTSFVQHDFDVTALGYAKGYVCNGVESSKPTYFYSDKDLSDKIYEIAVEKFSKDKIHRGCIASGDMFVAKLDKKQEIREMFDAMAAEMEGAAIAHCASLNGVPFVALRAISDLADGTKIENYPEFEIQTANVSANLLQTILKTLSE